MIGYVYCIINNITQETYIGRHNYKSKEKWLDYMGSGTLIKKAIEKYGKDNFSKILIEECENIETLMEREESWINHYKSIGKAEYNVALSGGKSSLGNYWPYLRPEDAQIISNKLSNSIKKSKKHKMNIKKAMDKRKKRNKVERDKFAKKYKDIVIDLYRKGYSMIKIRDKTKISRTVIRQILIENNEVDLNENGYIIRNHTEESKKKISEALKSQTAYKRPQKESIYCHQCGEVTDNLKYCSLECKNRGATKYNVPTDPQIHLEMKRLHEEGRSFTSIGKKYGITYKHVRKIIDDID